MKKLVLYIIIVLFVHQGFGQTINPPIKDTAIPVTSDTSLNKIITHGIYIEGLGRNAFYSIGYEYERIRNNNAFGLGAGTGVNIFLNSPSQRKYINLYFGLSPFYEYGKMWGFRTGLNIGIDLNPISFSNKLEGTAPPDRPYLVRQTDGIFLGGFYRTKNYRWQFILTFSTYYGFYKTPVFNGEKNDWAGELYPIIPGIAVKYNFKIKEK